MANDLTSNPVELRVQPYFGYRNDRVLVVTGRALRRRQPVFEARGFWRSLSTMMRQYASREVADLEVEFAFETASGDRVHHRARTNSEGFVTFEVPFTQSYPLPRETGWEQAVFRWQMDPASNGERPQREKRVFILAPGAASGVGVISDIDDTILETGITGSVKAIARNWKRVFAQMPGERIVAPGAAEFFADLSGVDGSAFARPKTSPEPRPLPRPVFYVSSSPWNLFSYLVTFKHQRDLPLGPIMLRDWGFNRKTLGSEGHGSHKERAARKILDAYPDMRFVLVGDDTQKDLAVFGALASAHPDRIAAVFIRRVSQRVLSAAEEAVVAAVKQARVPFWMGSDYADARRFLGSVDLTFGTKSESEIADAGAKD